MATKASEQKVTAGEVVSSTRKYTNKDNADRKFNISSDVTIHNGIATTFNNGSITSETNNGSANFSKGDSWLSFNANNTDINNIEDMFKEVLEFVSDVKKNVESTHIEA